jgi:hypothetical protein
MFPNAHPDIMGQLANQRAADLRADAERFRRARPFLAGWRKARFVEPVADLSRVSPAAETEGAAAGRAAGAARPGPGLRPVRKRRPWLVALPACWPPGPG